MSSVADRYRSSSFVEDKNDLSLILATKNNERRKRRRSDCDQPSSSNRTAYKVDGLSHGTTNNDVRSSSIQNNGSYNIILPLSAVSDCSPEEEVVVVPVLHNLFSPSSSSQPIADVQHSTEIWNNNYNNTNNNMSNNIQSSSNQENESTNYCLPFSTNQATNRQFRLALLEAKKNEIHECKESLLQYVGRLRNNSSPNMPWGFFDDEKNAYQNKAFDDAQNRLADDFACMHQEEGSGVQLPTDFDSPYDMESLRQPNVNDGGGRLYTALIRSNENEEVLAKLGLVWCSNNEKQGYYDEKYGVGNTCLKHVFALEDQSMKSQVASQKRFEASIKHIFGGPEITEETTLEEALDMERQGHPFLSTVIHRCAVDEVGSCVSGLCSKTFSLHCETGGTRHLERKNFFPPNLKSHPHEPFRGSLSPIFPAETEIARELRNYVSTYTLPQQQRIRTGRYQATSCQAWAPDINHLSFCLTAILMGAILHQKDPFNQGGLCVDAFLANHPRQTSLLRYRLPKQTIAIFPSISCPCCSAFLEWH